MTVAMETADTSGTMKSYSHDVEKTEAEHLPESIEKGAVNRNDEEWLIAQRRYL